MTKTEKTLKRAEALAHAVAARGGRMWLQVAQAAYGNGAIDMAIEGGWLKVDDNGIPSLVTG